MSTVTLNHVVDRTYPLSLCRTLARWMHNRRWVGWWSHWKKISGHQYTKVWKDKSCGNLHHGGGVGRMGRVGRLESSLTLLLTTPGGGDEILGIEAILLRQKLCVRYLFVHLVSIRSHYLHQSFEPYPHVTSTSDKSYLQSDSHAGNIRTDNLSSLQYDRTSSPVGAPLGPSPVQRPFRAA